MLGSSKDEEVASLLVRTEIREDEPPNTHSYFGVDSVLRKHSFHLELKGE